MKRHAEGLDGLRGLSALLVVFSHVAVVPLYDSSPELVLVLGRLARAAVIVFFVLSGHVIIGSILAMRDKGGFAPLVFAVNRFARVYPPFLLCLGLAWSIAWLRSTGAIAPQPQLMAEPLNTSPMAFVRDALFLFSSGTPVQNVNAPVWSLRIEVICYAIAGLVAAGAAARPTVRILLFVLAAGLLVAATLRLHDAVLGLAAFSVGGLAILVGQALPRGVLAGLWAVTAMAGVAVVAGLPELAGLPAARIFDGLAIAAAGATIVEIQHRDAGLIQSFVKLFQWLAPFSYTLFITHVPLVILLLGVIPADAGLISRVLGCGFMILAVVLFAWAAARVVERHLALRRWILGRFAPAATRN